MSEGMTKAANDLQAEVKSLRAQLSAKDLLLAEAKRALAWYADPIAYSMPVQDMKHHVFPDRGTTAQEALARIERGE